MNSTARGLTRPDGREPDPLSLLAVCDVLPPVTFDLGMPGWAPTLELTVHVRARPEPGWLKVRHATRNLSGGMFEEDCEIWDSAGRLVAHDFPRGRRPMRIEDPPRRCSHEQATHRGGRYRAAPHVAPVRNRHGSV